MARTHTAAIRAACPRPVAPVVWIALKVTFDHVLRVKEAKKNKQWRISRRISGRHTFTYKNLSIYIYMSNITYLQVPGDVVLGCVLSPPTEVPTTGWTFYQPTLCHWSLAHFGFNLPLAQFFGFPSDAGTFQDHFEDLSYLSSHEQMEKLLLGTSLRSSHQKQEPRKKPVPVPAHLFHHGNPTPPHTKTRKTPPKIDGKDMCTMWG